MSEEKNVAFIFPGQGSQTVGMLADYAASFSIVKETFSDASDALGYDLWATVQDGPQEKLNMTEITQPALLTSSVAIWRAWNARKAFKPTWVAGHSLGEWSALVCAGVVEFSDAVKLVRARGQYMQEAVPAGKGAMAAIIGLDDNIVEDVCINAEQGQVVAAVNYNSPGQVVIAGEVDAVHRAIEGAKEAGAKRALPLPVSAPFHTSLMKPAAERLAEEISATTFNTPMLKVVHNVTAKEESSPARIQTLMIEQIYSPVRWVECVQYLIQQSIDTFVECGPGKVLSGLNRRIDKSLHSLATDSVESFEKSTQA